MSQNTYATIPDDLVVWETIELVDPCPNCMPPQSDYALEDHTHEPTINVEFAEQTITNPSTVCADNGVLASDGNCYSISTLKQGSPNEPMVMWFTDGLIIGAVIFVAFVVGFILGQIWE